MTTSDRHEPESSDVPAANDPLGRELTPSLRLQILSTEHWSLLASRSLAWNESFSRAGMFLSTLSGAMVALALVAQASAFGSAFFIFALVILPIVLFVGVGTFLRLGSSNYHDAQCVIGMNRIRGAYLELAPNLARYFVMSAHDDPRGVGITMAANPHVGPVAHLLAATPFLISVLNAVLVGVIASLIALQFSLVQAAVLGAGAVGFVLAMAAHAGYSTHDIRRGQAAVRPLFPTPDA